MSWRKPERGFQGFKHWGFEANDNTRPDPTRSPTATGPVEECCALSHALKHIGAAGPGAAMQAKLARGESDITCWYSSERAQ
jgi:hypothetical protein